MSTTAAADRTVTIRGRQEERAAVLGLLAAAGDGRPGVLLLEGHPGAGRSLLLAEAARTAAARGLSTAIGAAWEPGRTPPLEPLSTAFGAEPGVRWPVAEVRSRLRAEAVPVLVGLDDLQWADPGTLRTVRALSRAGDPVAWLLTRETGRRGDPAGRFFDLMERDGARRCVLGPLRDDAVTEIVIDLLGARPDPRLDMLVAGAGGDPALLTDLLTGLLEEDAVRITDGRALPSSTRPPGRVRATVRQRLDALSPRTRHLVTVSAVLGRSFSPERLAEVLGAAPAVIVPELEEALASGLLAATPDGLRFQHALVWTITAETLPIPVRRALHRQIGELLAERRESAADAAFHLRRGVRAGDSRALAGMDRAIDVLLPRSPGAAADLAAHALALTGTRAAERPARTLTAVRALAAGGRLEEAADLARTAFTRPMPPRTCARLRCVLADILYVRGRFSAAAAEARAALVEPGLPPDLREDAELALLLASAATGEDTWARERAAAVVAAADRHGGAFVIGALTVLALSEWDHGRLGAGLRLAAEAVNRTTATDSVRARPRMVLATLLADVGRLEEARTVMAGAGEERDPLGPFTASAATAALRARLDLAEGRARESAIETVIATRGLVPHPLSAATLPVVAITALRAGDGRAARHHLPDCADAGRALVEAQITEACEGRGPLAETFGRVCEDTLLRLRGLVRDAAAAAWLVRMALALGDRPRARAVAAAAGRLARANPAFPTVRVAALHAHGLLHGDRRALAHAAAEHADPWARASAYEDIAVLVSSSDRDGAVAALDAALAGYEAAGAARDSARVRRRLRRLGVRRRHWNRADRPDSGWASLTETERGISELVATGLTNRQVADQLFMSTHTVAFHLRHVFRKLGIGSRVELARLTLDRSA
jgi:DNA-binding CsgD family transcriptional regulator